jgi:fructose-1-phosphate kinase PfkB-like protein
VDAPAAAARVGRALGARGIGMVVVSLGAAGAVAVRDGEAAHAWVSVSEAVHPVGSGDCLLAGVAVGLARGADMEEGLGVACGAANTVTAETGWLRHEDVDALRPRVSIAWLGSRDG